MSDPRLRFGNQDDVDEILDIHHASILALGRSAYTEQECDSWASSLSPSAYHDAMTSGGETFLVTELDRKLVGFCSFKVDEIVGLYVAPAENRKGLGSQLLCEAEALIARSGGDTLTVTAAMSALEFYQSHSYQIRSFLPWKTRGGLEIQVCQMEKNIV